MTDFITLYQTAWEHPGELTSLQVQTLLHEMTTMIAENVRLTDVMRNGHDEPFYKFLCDRYDARIERVESEEK